MCQDTYAEMLEICFKIPQQMKVKEKKDKWNRWGKTLIIVEYLSDGHMEEVYCTICLLLSVFTILYNKKNETEESH